MNKAPRRYCIKKTCVCTTLTHVSRKYMNPIKHKVSLQLTTHTGPYIQIGEDMITFIVDGVGNVTVEQYRHLKSYDFLEKRQNELQKINIPYSRKKK